MKSLIKYRLRFILPLILLLITLSCFDEITLDLPEAGNSKIVIEGYVNKGDDFLDVFFLAGVNAGVSELGGNVNQVPVSQAYLIFNNVAFPDYPLYNNQIRRLPLQAFESQAPGGENPVISLFVQLSDGRVYQSAPEPILPVPEAESIEIVNYTNQVVNNLGNLVDRQFMDIKINTPLRKENAEKSFLKWEMEGVYRFIEAPPPLDNPFEPQNTCYFNHRIAPNEILLFNGRGTSEDDLIRYPIIKDVPLNYYFASGYYLTIYQQSLSPQAFRYWDQLQQNAKLGGGLFEPTPGSITGNIQNTNDPEEQILGYFYASQVDTLRHYIRSGDIKGLRIFCYQQANINSKGCVDCTTLPGGTLQKPDYWID